MSIKEMSAKEKKSKMKKNSDSDLAEELNGSESNIESNEKVDEVDRLIEDQQQRIRELEEEIDQIKDAQLRKAAEMDNMRKRLNRDREMIFQTAREAAVIEFLPISDDLLRTLDAMKSASGDSPYLDGVQMIANKFDDILAKHNVKRIDEVGVPFNVDLHDAMLRQKPEDDSVESDTVLQIVENGYQMGDKTLRHAKVIVSE
tara:strand:- start:1489 stop:2094 length:606 start_codon:yes stop_codon:yes gene_type:complete